MDQIPHETKRLLKVLEIINTIEEEKMKREVEQNK